MSLVSHLISFQVPDSKYSLADKMFKIKRHVLKHGIQWMNKSKSICSGWYWSNNHLHYRTALSRSNFLTGIADIDLLCQDKMNTHGHQTTVFKVTFQDSTWTFAINLVAFLCLSLNGFPPPGILYDCLTPKEEWVRHNIVVWYSNVPLFQAELILCCNYRVLHN